MARCAEYAGVFAERVGGILEAASEEEGRGKDLNVRKIFARAWAPGFISMSDVQPTKGVYLKVLAVERIGAARRWEYYLFPMPGEGEGCSLIDGKLNVCPRAMQASVEDSGKVLFFLRDHGFDDEG